MPPGFGTGWQAALPAEQLGSPVPETVPEGRLARVSSLPAIQQVSDALCGAPAARGVAPT